MSTRKKAKKTSKAKPAPKAKPKAKAKPAPKARASKAKASKATPPKATKASGKRSRKPASGSTAVAQIEDTARTVYTKINRSQKPELAFPLRSLSNVRYDMRKGYFEIGRTRKNRTLTVNTVKTFAQTLRLMGLSKEMIGAETFATKREAYYVSKNWEEARFNDQAESDTVMDDIESLFSLHGIIFTQRVPFKLVVHQNSSQIRVVGKADAVHIPHLTFKEIRSRPQRGQ